LTPSWPSAAPSTSTSTRSNSFNEPATLNAEAKSLLRRALSLAMEWAEKGLVVPHIGKTINSSAIEINDGLQAMKAGKSPMGKVAVVVDQARESR
jgi:hypothetical protein